MGVGGGEKREEQAGGRENVRIGVRGGKKKKGGEIAITNRNGGGWVGVVGRRGGPVKSDKFSLLVYS